MLKVIRNVDLGINPMKKSLQYLFIESSGHPVQIDGLAVMQADSIPISQGYVTIRFLKGYQQDHGVRLKAKGGWIELSDGSHAEVVDTWRSPGLPDEITYKVSSPQKRLGLWNIYRIVHPDGTVSEDMWTGNAGIVVLQDRPNKRTYGCSPGGGDRFDPDALIVEVEWREKQ